MGDASPFDARESAYALIELIVERRKVYDVANDVISDAIGKATDEYTHRLQDIDGHLLGAICRHIDGLLGETGADLTSYYLNECIGKYGHGGSIECDGKSFKLRNMADLRRYIRHCDAMRLQAV